MEADPYPSGYRFPVEAVVFALWVTAGLVGTFVVPGPDKAYLFFPSLKFRFNFSDYIEFYYGPQSLVVIYCMLLSLELRS